eukprot:TRINITY_DN3372_c0_g1_i1.p1 TRINITY_DN3372_c0_g1~~TRINITY_DN3372_c0_g1_i1.p1  ORF type:complete len:310 (-),score=128.24 TRINITY_DN3372_c0_g1_i1:81-983(-)
MSTTLSTTLSTAEELLEEFKLLVNQSAVSVDRALDVLEKLKLEVMKFTFMNGPRAGFLLQPSAEQRNLRVMEMTLARELLEHACMLSIALRDIPAFARYFVQLRPFYFDYRCALQRTRHVPNSTPARRNEIPVSEREHMLLGLNLLRLLAQNNIAKFHMELECLPLEVHNVRYIKFPMELEQYMMEGSYNKVLQARDHVPSDKCNLFMDILSETVRNDIASCSQVAYQKISVPVAKQFLRLEDDASFFDYCAKRKWTVNHDTNEIIFQASDAAAGKVTDVPSFQLIKEMLSYAKELERIV